MAILVDLMRSAAADRRHRVEEYGDQLLFFAKSLRAVPYVLRHYRREIWTILAEVAFGAGALTMIAGTAGVIAFMFGRGADGVTCACDANGDGITNPAAINGNTRLSLSADDDGGFFRERTNNYYANGAMPLR